MMSERATSQCLRKNEKKIDHWNKRTEKKMPTSTTNDLGKHPSKKVRTELLENQQRKEQACCGLMEHISKLCGDNPPLTETVDWIEINMKMKTSSPR